MIHRVFEESTGIEKTENSLPDLCVCVCWSHRVVVKLIPFEMLKQDKVVAIAETVRLGNSFRGFTFSTEPENKGVLYE